MLTEGWLLLALSLWMVLTSTETISKADRQKRCGPRLNVLWSREASHVPVVAAPLVADIGANGGMDIVVASFNGEVHVLRGDAGQATELEGWPQKVPHSTIHASPLLMDVDGNGMMDILITTSQGELVFFNHKGDKILNKHYQVPELAVQKDWYSKQISLDQVSIHEYILDDLPDPQVSSQYVLVDPHILSSPVVADINRDGVSEELAVSISYYFDQDYYVSHPDALDAKKLSLSELDKYVASSLLILNTTSMRPIRILHLELTKSTSEFPGYALSAPTVVDLDKDVDSEMEVLLGTSAGQIHVFTGWHGYREGFPIPTSSLSGQIIAEDVNQDGSIDLIAVDVSGKVMCFSANGDIIWEQHISGSGVTGIRVSDLDGDLHLEVVIATNDGQVWVLSGETGVVVRGWPVRVCLSLQAPPLIVQLNGQSTPVVVVAGDDSHLHLLSANSSCRRTLNTWEKSYAALVSHDLVSQSEGLELVIASQDGTVLCLGQLPMADGEDVTARNVDPSLSWPAETKSSNDFTYLPFMRGVVIQQAGQTPVEFTGSSFTVSFTIHGSLPLVKHQYVVQVFLGRQLLAKQTFPSAGTYSMTVLSPQIPVVGHLVLQCSNQHGQIFTDTMSVRFHTSVMSDLKWLFLSPVLGMGILLLILHGFPDVDLLPMTLPGKKI